jgi:glyoxylase-like metal-dependent hydrolase (beta-lactamase superfamily II)
LTDVFYVIARTARILELDGMPRELRQAILCAALLVGPPTETTFAQKSTERAVVTVRPIHTGVCQIGQDHVLGGEHTADERLPFVIYSFLVEGDNGAKALVDLGPKTLDYCNGMFRRHGFFRDLGSRRPRSERFPDDIVQPHGNLFDQLRELKIVPDEIGHIIFSHLHADHHGMDDARNGGAAESFTNALLHLSARGWKDNVDRRADGRWNSYVDFAFADFIERRQQSRRVQLDDDSQVMPGVRTLYLGGHSVCSQAVLLDTADGLVILASDDIYLYRLLEGDILPRIRTSETAYRAALDRLARLALDRDAIIVAMHDPVVWEKWQQGGRNWLRELKPVSDRAVRRYARARGWTK